MGEGQWEYNNSNPHPQSCGTCKVKACPMSCAVTSEIPKSVKAGRWDVLNVVGCASHSDTHRTLVPQQSDQFVQFVNWLESRVKNGHAHNSYEAKNILEEAKSIAAYQPSHIPAALLDAKKRINELEEALCFIEMEVDSENSLEESLSLIKTQAKTVLYQQSNGGE